MEKDKDKTVVVFRKFYKPEDGAGDVIAIFPELKNYPYACSCESYMHIGQHGAASLNIDEWTKPASPKEYADLKAELEDIGYNLVVKKRIPRKRI